ncbi:MAG: 16S rRNA processing protein RimM [Armatimonadetes bacterium]|nr:16S rRNA processing protein RimM [Armatimonadota bacterium]
MSDEYVVRAVIGAPHGVKGQVRVAPRTDFPERLVQARTWRLRRRNGEQFEATIETVGWHHEVLLAKLAGFDNREAAESLRGVEVVSPEEELPPLPEGEYYWHQLIGLEVVTVDGRRVGRIRDILVTGSNDVYVTEGPLIPAIKEVVERVDLEAGQMIIRPMPGLLD